MHQKRRGRDSNSRFQLRNGGLVNRCFRPLSHLSSLLRSVASGSHSRLRSFGATDGQAATSPDEYTYFIDGLRHVVVMTSLANPTSLSFVVTKTEAGGFEPPRRFHPCQFSKLVLSTTQPRLLVVQERVALGSPSRPP